MKYLVSCLVLLITLINSDTYAESSVVLTESMIKSLIQAEPPSVRQIELSFLAAKQQSLALEDQLSWRVDAQGQNYKSDEKLLNSFDGGVVRRNNAYTVGISKPTRFGVDVSLKAFTEKVTNAFVTDAATSGATIGLSIDLYKNFFGRQTNNNLKKFRAHKERAQIEKQIGLKTFEANVRKIYWSLVANEQQKKILERLVLTAKKQLKDVLRRKRSGVSDAGEVARFQSVASSREANLLSLEYQRRNLLRSLRELFPELIGKKIETGESDTRGVRERVLACTALIASRKKIPFDFTYYDEVVRSLEKEAEYERKTISTYDGPDIKLTGEHSSVGRDFGFENSRQDFYDNSRARTSVQLQISIPLGGRKKKTEEVLRKMVSAQYVSMAKQNLLKIEAYHTETSELVFALQKVIKSQKSTNKFLSQSLRSSRRKFKQARIGVQELISEQDALLQSQLNEINTNLTVLNTLIDYFSIYTEIPCAFNKI